MYCRFNPVNRDWIGNINLFLCFHCFTVLLSASKTTTYYALYKLNFSSIINAYPYYKKLLKQYLYFSIFVSLLFSNIFSFFVWKHYNLCTICTIVCILCVRYILYTMCLCTIISHILYRIILENADFPLFSVIRSVR